MNAKSCCVILTAGLMTAALPGFAQMQNQTPNSTQTQTQNQNWNNNSANGPSQNAQAPIRGHREAMRMVPARAIFTHTVESQKAQPGTTVNVKLTKAVKLEDGTTLPKGTVLDGRVVTDNSQPGNARLALRFDEARLESGQKVPIKATIIGIYDTPTGDDSAGYWGGTPGSTPPSWNDGTLQIDQIDALPGIDLHSRIASPNSGVFVSTKKDDIKLSSEYSLTLAVTDLHNNGRANMGDNQGYPANGQNNNSFAQSGTQGTTQSSYAQNQPH